jgi:hypothetical protein
MRLFLSSLLLLAGCTAISDDGPWPVEGTTWRIEKPAPNERSDTKIDVFANRDDCLNAYKEVDSTEVDLCVPKVDRASGQVHMGFRLVDKKSSDVQYLPLNQTQVEVAHLSRTITDAEKWELIPHGPMAAGQLYIIIIDGSASIYQTGGIKKVKKALQTPAVIESFLPERGGQSTGVLLLRFSEELKTIDGKDPLTAPIIEKKKVYEEMVEKHVENPSRGFSHVYDALVYASTTLLESKEIKNWLQVNSATPTIVLLTDGFNNEAASDVCSDNVSRLNSAIDKIRKARLEGGIYHSTVYTVGLGKAINKSYAIPAGGGAVTEGELCRDYGDAIINGGLEARIDNPSLVRLADVGGGKSFVSNNHKGLADVFLAAAAQRYKWYEVRYTIDNYYLRRSFDARIRLKQFAQAETTVKFHPSAWMDSPSGLVPEGERWFQATPFRHSLLPVTGLLGLLVTFAFVGPASFNARRALFRRVRRK